VIDYAERVKLTEARDRAKEAMVAAKQGRDILRGKDVSDPTMAVLFARFVKEHGAKRSRQTAVMYRSAWKNMSSIKNKPLSEVVYEDFARLHLRMRSKPVAANRMLAVASKMFDLAARWDMFPRNQPNPAKGHDKYPERKIKRSLTVGQLTALGPHLEDTEVGRAFLITLLTGCRPGEIVSLKWAYVDGRVIHFPIGTTKTGEKQVFLSASVVGYLGERRDGRVFPNVNLKKLSAYWGGVRSKAGLPTDLVLYEATRHTFMTQASEIGIERWVRQLLVGHALSDVSAGYEHPGREFLLTAADRISAHLLNAVRG
jgi:integrase